MNIKLTITFNGRDFYGWQSQKSKITIQGLFENITAKIYKVPIKIYGCSRTDKSVNAINYIANFHPPFFIEKQNLIRALNSLLPKTIRIKNLEYVNETFHARFASKSKTYIYRLYNQIEEHNYKIFDELCGIEKNPLNLQQMKKAAEIFLGEHDFLAFSIKNSKENTLCNISYFKIIKKNNYFYFIIKGNRFLHKMIRFLVASTLEIGKNNLKITNLLVNLEKKERIYPIKPVVANGLFLKRVHYE